MLARDWSTQIRRWWHHTHCRQDQQSDNHDQKFQTKYWSFQNGPSVKWGTGNSNHCHYILKQTKWNRKKLSQSEVSEYIIVHICVLVSICVCDCTAFYLCNGSGVLFTHLAKDSPTATWSKRLLVVTGVRCGAQAQIRCKVGGTGGLY